MSPLRGSTEIKLDAFSRTAVAVGYMMSALTGLHLETIEGAWVLLTAYCLLCTERLP